MNNREWQNVGDYKNQKHRKSLGILRFDLQFAKVNFSVREASMELFPLCWDLRFNIYHTSNIHTHIHTLIDAQWIRTNGKDIHIVSRSSQSCFIFPSFSSSHLFISMKTKIYEKRSYEKIRAAQLSPLWEKGSTLVVERDGGHIL